MRMTTKLLAVGGALMLLLGGCSARPLLSEKGYTTHVLRADLEAWAAGQADAAIAKGSTSNHRAVSKERLPRPDTAGARMTGCFLKPLIARRLPKLSTPR